jgi:hypothetical protein
MEGWESEAASACGESLSAFLDGELTEVDCARLLETVRKHPEAGRSLSRYSLIREILHSEEWKLREWVGGTRRPPAPERRRSRFPGGRLPGLWAWRGAFALSLAVLLAVGLRDDGSRTGLAHPPSAFLEARPTISVSPPYGRVRSVSWNVTSRAVRRQLTTYWMLHAASISATPTMAYSRIAAYNYAVSGRGQRWQRRHRHP